MATVNLTTYPELAAFSVASAMVDTFDKEMMESIADATEVPVCVPDVSKWQGDIDADKFIAAGAHGVIIRAGAVSTAGTCYRDDRFYSNKDKFLGRIPCGAYWFYRPEHDPAAQAGFFSSLVGKDFFPLVADVEVNTTGVGMVDFARWLYKFLDAVYVNTGIWPVIYTRGSFWNPQLGNPEWAPQFGLWVARYSNTLTGPWSDGYYRPLPWHDWRLWQWSADGNGMGKKYGAESHSIDLNRWNPEVPFLFDGGNGGQPPPPPNPGDMTIQMQALFGDDVYVGEAVLERE